ncbi:MAG: hypothetical protein ABJK59_14070 [Erythrobacter sp.]|uniref:hypothetical protein n=1 Tax=Erythrobacter sp. TaxID=1042 RepID=UPI003298FC1C
MFIKAGLRIWKVAFNREFGHKPTIAKLTGICRLSRSANPFQYNNHRALFHSQAFELCQLL